MLNDSHDSAQYLDKSFVWKWKTIVKRNWDITAVWGFINDEGRFFYSCLQQSCQGPLKEVQAVGAPLRSAEYQGENLLQVCGSQAESSHSWKDFELRVTHIMSQQNYLSLIDRVGEIPNCTQD